jgi:benzoylformate decarboxylase
VEPRAGPRRRLCELLPDADPACRPITYVIVNNSQYAILKAFAVSSGITDSVPGPDLPRLDITRIAEGFGCKAETVEEPDKLEEMLLRALEHESPYLVNVMVDRAVPDLLA